MRTHLMRLAQNTGTRDPRLTAVCPPAGAALWDAFNAMGRPSGEGFAYLTQQEIAAYQANYQIRFTGWELDTIRILDNVAAHVSAKHQQSKAQ